MFSVEYFPVAQTKAVAKVDSSQSRQQVPSLVQCHNRMVNAGFEAASVTFGALSQESDGDAVVQASLQTLSLLRQQASPKTHPSRLMAHVCVRNMSWQRLEAYADALRSMDINDVLALRGDNCEAHQDGPSDVLALITFFKRQGFEVSVAGYPEAHPESQSAGSDFDWLKRKEQAGASRVFSQFCFDTPTINRFGDRLKRETGLAFFAGILLVTDPVKAARFAERCGAKMPTETQNRFAAVEPDNYATVGAMEAYTQAAELQQNGIENLHFYALNKPQIAEAVLAMLRNSTVSQRVAA